MSLCLQCVFYTCTFTYTHAFNIFNKYLDAEHVSMLVICIVYVHLYVYTHSLFQACVTIPSMYICIYVCVYVCMYVHKFLGMCYPPFYDQIAEYVCLQRWVIGIQYHVYMYAYMHACMKTYMLVTKSMHTYIQILTYIIHTDINTLTNYAHDNNRQACYKNIEKIRTFTQAVRGVRNAGLPVILHVCICMYESMHVRMELVL